jgi:hypothetical protein
MCILTPEKEKSLREALKNKISELPEAFVFSRRRRISSKQDFFAQLGKTVDSKTEVRFCQIDYLGFEDVLGEGLDDCPPVKVNYSLHVFFQFADLRSDDSNSTDDFISYCLNLRHQINHTQEIVLSGKKHLLSNLLQVSDTITDSDTVSGVEGHYAEFRVTIEVRE